MPHTQSLPASPTHRRRIRQLAIQILAAECAHLDERQQIRAINSALDALSEGCPLATALLRARTTLDACLSMPQKAGGRF